MDICQAAVHTILTPCQLCMVNTEQVQNRRMEVVRIRRVLSSLERKLIALTIP